MALINCPDCGKLISDKAAFCIGCGCPSPNENEQTAIKDLLLKSSNYIYFGEYPQTIASAAAIQGLGKFADKDGYFYSTFDGERYAKFVATPFVKDFIFSNGEKIINGVSYYFKVEPLKWRILKEKDGKALLLTELIIDNTRFNSDSNLWANSEIRAWLNKEFYAKAFNRAQQNIIQLTALDNKNTGFYMSEQEDTLDKIFLLSYKDIVNTAYGFYEGNKKHDAARRGLTSDYSRAKGVWINPESSFYGNGYWWLRSAGSHSYYVSSVYSHGYVYVVGSYVNYQNRGVRPALKIAISGK